MTNDSHSATGQMENWRMQFSEFSRKDRIGKVMEETTNLLSELCAENVSVADLKYASDSVRLTRANTLKHYGTELPLNLEELQSAYYEMRNCCYGLTEAVEMSVRILITNNRIERLTEHPIAESSDADRNSVKEEPIEYENDEVVDFSMRESINSSEKNSGMDDLAETSKKYINPNEFCLLPKEELEEDDEEDDDMSINQLINKLSSVGNSKNGVNRSAHCSFCNMLIKGGHLKAHERTHTGQKPFKCSHCDLTFARKDYLKLHERRKHTGERPYQCDQCPTTFFQKSELNKHMRIHNGEKPFKCDECSLSFTQKAHLKSHKDHIHRAG